jgi:hypothetical protein
MPLAQHRQDAGKVFIATGFNMRQEIPPQGIPESEILLTASYPDNDRAIRQVRGALRLVRAEHPADQVSVDLHGARVSSSACH